MQFSSVRDTKKANSKGSFDWKPVVNSFRVQWRENRI